jgi:hypothetical protein
MYASPLHKSSYIFLQIKQLEASRAEAEKKKRSIGAADAG